MTTVGRASTKGVSSLASVSLSLSALSVNPKVPSTLTCCKLSHSEFQEPTMVICAAPLYTSCLCVAGILWNTLKQWLPMQVSAASRIITICFSKMHMPGPLTKAIASGSRRRGLGICVRHPPGDSGASSGTVVQLLHLYFRCITCHLVHTEGTARTPRAYKAQCSVQGDSRISYLGNQPSNRAGFHYSL